MKLIGQVCENQGVVVTDPIVWCKLVHFFVIVIVVVALGAQETRSAFCGGSDSIIVLSRLPHGHIYVCSQDLLRQTCSTYKGICFNACAIMSTSQYITRYSL